MQKSHIVGISLATAVAILFLGASKIQAEPTTRAQEPDSRHVIRVSGSATVYAKPDIATAYIGVAKSGDQVMPAKGACDQTMAKAQAALKKAGVAPEDIQTASYDIAPIQPANKPESARTWKVSHYLVVKVRKVAALGTVLDAAAEAGATNISRVDYGIEKVIELRSKARGQAMKIAREKAEELARLSGMRVGSPVSISENAYDGYAAQSNESYGMGGASFGAGLSEGQNGVNARVDVEFAMAPG